MGKSDLILSKSRRNPRDVHGRAMAWIRRMPGYEPIEYQPRDEDGEVRHMESWIHNPSTVIRAVEQDLADGKTVMALASCEYMLRPLIKELRERALPFHNPYRLKNRQWNPLWRGSTEGKREEVSPTDRVLSFLSPSRTGEFRRADLVKVVGYVKVAAALTTPRKHVKELPVSESGELDMAALTAALTPAAMDAFLSGDLDWLAVNLSRRGAEYPIRVAKVRGPEALEREPLVTVGTIHSCKGGEASSVYLAPDLSKSGRAAWVDNDPAIYRLFYVGMTRARETLTLMSPASWKAVRL